MTKTGGRFQFGLRKLLLWTAVVALLLGLAKMSGIREGWIAFPCWIVMVAVIRVVASPIATAIVSAASGMVLLAWVRVAARVDLGPPASEIMTALHKSGSLLVAGCLLGLTLFAVAELLRRAVDWADNVLSRVGGPKTNGPRHDD
jgi:hypothetical protein